MYKHPQSLSILFRLALSLAALVALAPLEHSSAAANKVAVVNDGPPGEPVYNVYLPLVVASGPLAPPPASPYAAALNQALADCAGTALNQVCYARGSVTLDGGGPLTTPGQVATLDGVSGLTLVSPDAGHWSVALLRLAEDASTPDLGLTLLAFGNVEIRNLTHFDAALGNGDVAPALSFSSSPAPGEDPVTGGLIVYNPTDEEPLSIRLNGADLTLASSAVVQAQPGANMTVTMATGTGLVSTAAGDGAVVQAHQLTVPLDNAGTATGAPTTPTVPGEELLAPLTPLLPGEELLVELVPATPPDPDTSDIWDRLLAAFDSAFTRCVQGNSRQVYRVMYYARLLKMFENKYPDGMMSLIDPQVSQCATFEVEFNSVITVTSSLAWGNMYVQGQGMMVSYGMDGSLDQPATMPLTHVRYDIDFALDPCLSRRFTDGTLSHFDGYMRINRNRLDISTTLAPAGIHALLTFTCSDPPMDNYANPADWPTMFRQFHQSEQILTGYQFTPAHWKYTGNQILAEAIFADREVMFADGVATEATWMVMLHRPVH